MLQVRKSQKLENKLKKFLEFQGMPRHPGKKDVAGPNNPKNPKKNFRNF
jgi:hypothetical protein